MVLEIATLDVKSGEEKNFERAFAEARLIISQAPGYISHQLQHCIETPNRYTLLVHWQRLEDHTEGFRTSEQYQKWKGLLHHFYDPFPTVEHYRLIASCSSTPE
jgi:heme-degrading monooxygenase HmoA